MERKTEMSDIEEKLRNIIRDLKRKNERLESELSMSRSALDSAEYRIEQELVPRIKREEHAYDSWALSPERG